MSLFLAFWIALLSYICFFQVYKFFVFYVKHVFACFPSIIHLFEHVICRLEEDYNVEDYKGNLVEQVSIQYDVYRPLYIEINCH